MKKTLLLILLFAFGSAFPQQNLWQKVSEDRLNGSEKLDRSTTILSYDVYELSLTNLKSQLNGAIQRNSEGVKSTVIISFPNSEGELVDFRIYEASNLHPQLAATHPDIKSYVGVAVNDKSSTIRFSTTIFGFHGMIFSSSGTTLIDPYTKDLNHYLVYAKKNTQTDRYFECLVEEVAEELPKGVQFSPKNANSIEANTGIFRTYRLALASTEEYSQFHINQAGVAAGTVAQRNAAVLAAMNVTMTRVNGVYERDMSLTMQIVPTNTSIIFFLPEKPDSYSNNDGGALLNQNQTAVDAAIGSSNYDIGHVFSTGGGGIAQLNSPCSANKARGVTGSGAPVGDAFDIDYVAHEMGHQFGATHTQNNSCQRTAVTAVEPGSASTIMGYAGICPPNVQNNSDAHFHAFSLAQMDAFVAAGGNCSVNSANNNAAPVITPIPNFTIPISTAFELPGNATDANGDALTYCWEQTNIEISTQPPAATNTGGPSFRSLPPSASPNRYLPAMNSILSGLTSNTWEVVPSVARTMGFALTVRDNRTPNGGQTARANMNVTTVATAGPFVVTAPNTAVSWQAGSTQTVIWNVAGTTANGVNTPNVDIYLSTNGGSTFPILLASQVPNDGSELITVPNSVGTSNRIMVKGSGNIFLDVSNANFSITAPVSTMAVAFSGVVGEQNKTVCKGSNATFTFNYQTFAGFNASTAFSVTGQPAGTTAVFTPASTSTAGAVTLQISNTTPAPVGFYTLVVTATSGATVKTMNFYLNLVDGDFFPPSLSTPANNATGINPASLTFNWLNDPGATSYDIQISTVSSFATTVVEANVTTNSYTATNLPSSATLFWRVKPKNNACAGNYSAFFTFSTIFCGQAVSTNVPVTIPTTVATVSSTLTIPNTQNVVIQKITATLNVTHTWINDLVVTLISPTGTQVQLMSQECTSSGAFQNTVATFDDLGAGVVCSTTPPALSGILLPQQPLSAFNGQNSQGIWTLQVQDLFNQDGGSINSWSITICSANPPLTIDDNQFLDFSMYPNPTKGSFTIQMGQTLSEKINIGVYDMSGRLVFDKNYTSNGSLEETITLNSLQSGVYLVSVTDGTRKEVKKLIVE
jgi:subtilisin-like proprotein convertase family protein